MSLLSDFYKFYNTADATVLPEHLKAGETAFGPDGKVTGTLVKFTPLDIPNLHFWLDAANRGTTDNRWDDVSGNNRHFTATGPSTFPVFSGGVATCEDDYLTGPSLTTLTQGELFVLQKRYADNGDANQDSGGSFRFGTDASLIDHFTYGSTVYSDFGRTARITVGNPIPNTGEWHILNVLSKAADWRYYMNEYTLYSTTSNTVAFRSTPTVCGQSPGMCFKGDIKAFIFYSRVLDTLERAQVRGYLAGL